MRTAMVSKEWGEVKRNGHKVEGWSWEVAFLTDGVVVDRHYYKTDYHAQNAAALFEGGKYHESEFGGVEFEEVG
jgi:hypothetical protein